MLKATYVNKFASSSYNTTLYKNVKSLKVPLQQVRKLYGEIGVDIFEGRKPTILSNEEIAESKKIINRIKAWWSGMSKFDYEEGDRLSDVILKYASNKKSGSVKDIEIMFGQVGVKELEVMRKMGLII